MEASAADEAAIAAAHREVCDAAGAAIGFDISGATDGATLLATKFGQLVWLCRALEVAYERYTGGAGRPAPAHEYDALDASRNVAR